MSDEVKIGAAYVRVSTDSQLDLSPDSQLKAIMDYAKREGYIIPDEYIFREDEGISGKSADKRPKFRLMIATAKQDSPPFDSIFVWKYSRFARNQEEAIMYKNLLKKRGVAVRSISEPSSDSPFASLIERIIEWMDEYYLINLASEVRRGKTEKATRGEYSGRPPYGYDLVNKTLIPNGNADYVRYIFDRYAAGDAVIDIAKSVAAMGARTVNGILPDNRFVLYIIQNSVYIGRIRYSPDGRMDYLYNSKPVEQLIEVDGHHEPIIDRETWELAQKRYSGKTREMRYARKENPDGHMLKGLLRCGSCGATLVKGNQFANDFSLQCNGYCKGKCKVSHYIMASRANEIVIAGLEQCLQNRTYTFAPKPKKKAKTASVEWDKLIQAEQTKLSRAKDAYLGGIFDIEEYKRIRDEIEQTIDRLQTGKATESAEVRSVATPAEMEKKTVEVMKIITSPDVSERAKNEALRSILDKIVFNKAQNTFDFYFTP